MTLLTATLSLVFWPVVIKNARRLPGPDQVQLGSETI